MLKYIVFVIVGVEIFAYINLSISIFFMSKNRSWCFTLNNYTSDEEAHYRTIEAKYICFGYEEGETGTPHLQGYVQFKSPRSLRSVRRAVPRAHLTVANGSPAQNRAYCSKSIDTANPFEWFEYGDIPIGNVERGVKERERWQSAWELAKCGEFESIDADIRIRSYGTLKRIEQDYMERKSDLPAVCGTWIVGEAGSGKSHSAFTSFPEAYRKPVNKWWDGYQGEEVVVLDDLGNTDTWAGNKLKHWADRYAFIAEIKGGSKLIRPERFIVTSQYEIEDIWSDSETREALNRRFSVIRKVVGQEILL